MTARVQLAQCRINKATTPQANITRFPLSVIYGNVDLQEVIHQNTQLQGGGREGEGGRKGVGEEVGGGEDGEKDS